MLIGSFPLVIFPWYGTSYGVLLLPFSLNINTNLFCCGGVSRSLITIPYYSFPLRTRADLLLVPLRTGLIPLRSNCAPPKDYAYFSG